MAANGRMAARRAGAAAHTGIGAGAAGTAVGEARPGAPSEPGETGGAGRPRSEAAHRAILEATLRLLSEVGFSALTVEGVAQRAGVGKATIYRRWPSKLPLVVEAFSQLPAFEDADTGSLEGDLRAILQQYLANFLTTPLAAVYPSLAAERVHNPELGALLDPLLQARRRPLEAALRRAQSRGELAPGANLELAADLIVGPIAVHLFFRGARLHPTQAAPLVRLALRGIAPLAGGAGGGAG